MTVLYVARSRELSRWAAEVGLTREVYKLGVAESAKAALEALNAAAFAGESDWKLAASAPAEGLTEEAALERLARKERMVDPAIYPKLKGARGIFKVKLANVESHLLVRQALAGEEPTAAKPKPADVALYMIRTALK